MIPQTQLPALMRRYDRVRRRANDSKDRYAGYRALLLKVIIRAIFDWVCYRDSTKLEKLKIAESAATWLFEPSKLFNGLDNFCMSTMLGLSTATRARTDIEDMISSLEEDPSAVLARDMAIRLISDRAALKVIGSLPDFSEPVVSSDDALPRGYELKAASEPAPATVTSLPGPFVLPVGAQLTTSINGGAPSTYFIPQPGFDLQNRACLVSDAVTFPVTVPAYHYLFLVIDKSDGTQQSYRVNLNDTASPVSVSKASFISLINSALGADGGALEFIGSGTNRVLIYAHAGSSPTQDRLSVGASHSEPSTSTIGVNSVYYTTDPSQFGLNVGQSGDRGTTRAQLIVDAFNWLFSGVLTAVMNTDGSFTVSSVASDTGTFFTFTAPAVLGISGTISALVSQLRLYGSVYGVETDPVDASTLADVGDVVITPSGTSTIASFDNGLIVLEDALNSFDGPITINSILAQMGQALDDLVDAFLPIWGATKFSDDLNTLDAAEIGRASCRERV